MNDDRLLDVLTRIEDNQRKALEAQERLLHIAQAQLDRSNTTIEESIALQRVAVSRQAKVTRLVLPLIGVLILLVVYLIVKWRILW